MATIGAPKVDRVLSSRAITEQEAFQYVADFLRHHLASTRSTSNHLDDLLPVAESLANTECECEVIRQLRVTAVDDVAAVVVSPIKSELTSPSSTYGGANPSESSNYVKANADIDPSPSSAAVKQEHSEDELSRTFIKEELDFGHVAGDVDFDERSRDTKKKIKKEAKKKKRKRDS